MLPYVTLRLFAEMAAFALCHVDVEVIAVSLVGLGSERGTENPAGGGVSLAQKAALFAKRNDRFSRRGDGGGGRARLLRATEARGRREGMGGVGFCRLRAINDGVPDDAGDGVDCPLREALKRYGSFGRRT